MVPEIGKGFAPTVQHNANCRPRIEQGGKTIGLFLSSGHDPHCVHGVLDTQNQPHGHDSAPIQSRTMAMHIDALLEHHSYWPKVHSLHDVITCVPGRGRRLLGLKKLDDLFTQLYLSKEDKNEWHNAFLNIGQYLGIDDDPTIFLNDERRKADPSLDQIKTLIQRPSSGDNQPRVVSTTSGDEALQTKSTSSFPELNPKHKRPRLNKQ